MEIADGTYSVRLGNHWFARFGWKIRSYSWRVVYDDVRAQLPHDIAPGEAAEVVIVLTAPTEPDDIASSWTCCRKT